MLQKYVDIYIDLFILPKCIVHHVQPGAQLIYNFQDLKASKQNFK